MRERKFNKGDTVVFGRKKKRGFVIGVRTYGGALSESSEYVDIYIPVMKSFTMPGFSTVEPELRFTRMVLFEKYIFANWVRKYAPE